mmetsp:Transcript_3235/g.7257  ORF Transcript_3235/g.7257 Transcript_3235/m.7257 type:complete len:215 (+) Transcript_3235:1601-2245(+)
MQRNHRPSPSACSSRSLHPQTLLLMPPSSLLRLRLHHRPLLLLLRPLLLRRHPLPHPLQHRLRHGHRHRHGRRHHPHPHRLHHLHLALGDHWNLPGRSDPRRPQHQHPLRHRQPGHRPQPRQRLRFPADRCCLPRHRRPRHQHQHVRRPQQLVHSRPGACSPHLRSVCQSCQSPKPAAMRIQSSQRWMKTLHPKCSCQNHQMRLEQIHLRKVCP